MDWYNKAFNVSKNEFSVESFKQSKWNGIDNLLTNNPTWSNNDIIIICGESSRDVIFLNIPSKLDEDGVKKIQDVYDYSLM